MKEQTKAGRSSGEQTIEELRKRYEKLHTRKIQAETNLENTENQLDALKNEALEKYGTDDVGKLREMLLAMKSENDAKRSRYQTELDRIESDLAAVERKFALSEGEEAAIEGTN